MGVHTVAMNKLKPLCFYMDDSGTRHPSKKATGEVPDHDWFALGGILINEVDIESAKKAVDDFMADWPAANGAPLHSYDIRQRKAAFKWLQDVDAATSAKFFNGLTELIASLPVVVMACVIDRPGYNKRYEEVYGTAKWQLCKSAFTIAVERAAKFAMHRHQRLRVYVERSDKKTEDVLRGYYDALRMEGGPFNKGTSAVHQPLSQADFQRTLMEFAVKQKTARLMQIADLVLWPVCKGGYVSDTRAYRALQDSGKLLDAYCNDANQLKGVKYFCFDRQTAEKQEPAEAGS